MVHLWVLQHGLWGYRENLAIFQQILQASLEEKVGVDNFYILNSHVNEYKKTYDGVDGCGDRLLEAIQEVVKLYHDNGTPFTKVSFIGYSLGGLINRYVIGRLHVQGFFNDVKPVNFVTIATPHLGAWQFPASIFRKIFNAMVPVISSHTGYQLMLQDKAAFGIPLMCNMVDPDLPFMQALAAFQNLVLLANAKNDRMVPYCSAAICLDYPYSSTNEPVAVNDAYPHIVQPADKAAEAAAITQRQVKAQATRKSGCWALGLLLVLSPVVVPVVLVPSIVYMTMAGKAHYCKTKKKIQQQQDPGSSHYDWLEGPYQPGLTSSGSSANLATSKGAAGPGKEGEAGADPAAATASSDDVLISVTGQEGGSKGAAAAGAGGDASRVQADARSAGVAPAGSDEKVPDEKSALVVKEGIVQQPVAVHEVQELMANHLNNLPWKKIDVDTQELNAHAAIVCRRKPYDRNRDVLDFLLTQLSV
mmetsp:Transcript_6267/g.13747  ORF Transcript_6267/g.13747 Transcript_6267/m.13747 type:complete len:475 (-) Transcript_6267:741-2165(-)|eukprot:CAMPEP_0202891072 /NCGR_PEP_ID=MMETSP1392-20130828/1247_1 /ASSEMBLY_ACC=CAM_ASM_000868 /TAXON_ID=225041 /ORGANISM="Chlamydomonas chlamydogama, Strain SAG 11-48b" /LENGTH=474 /DNA_ID=CAMNT_0049574745 /DNA_START=248 /DNA_END=1672 /DNA_ORIENTATION=-